MGRSSGAVARTPTIGVSTTPLRAGEGLWYNPLRMLKKGFTLVELLIVIVIIAILMSITYRIMGVSEDQTARQWTVMRLHGLENAIGGYYAVFGSYPPVRLHGSRNIFCRLNRQGIQLVNQIDEGVLVWDRVRAACLSQPVAMSYPPCEWSLPLAAKISKELLELAKEDPEFGSGSTALVAFDGIPTTGRFSGKEDEVEWTQLNLFKFGLMSFLLPRYLYMMQGADPTLYDKFAQWGDNNNVPCKFEDGIPFDTWRELADQSRPNSDGTYNPDLWKVALMPSQIVTARWMPYLSEICFFNYGMNSLYTTMWGVNLFCSQPMATWLCEPAFRTQTGKPWRRPPVYTAGDQQSVDNGFTQAFMPDGVSVLDGWGEEFYYYSPPPHQGYRLWSGGFDPTARSDQQTATFPPWISETEIDKILSPADAKLARRWKADDIVHMSN